MRRALPHHTPNTRRRDGQEDAGQGDAAALEQIRQAPTGQLRQLEDYGAASPSSLRASCCPGLDCATAVRRGRGGTSWPRRPPCRRSTSLPHGSSSLAPGVRLAPSGVRLQSLRASTARRCKRRYLMGLGGAATGRRTLRLRRPRENTRDRRSSESAACRSPATI